MAKLRRLISLTPKNESEDDKLRKVSEEVISFSGNEPSRKIISPEELYSLNPEDIGWIIPDHLPDGLAILAGEPKIRKTNLALSIAIDVSRGDKVLGMLESNASPVLYVSLEETKGSFRDRFHLDLSNRGLKSSDVDVHFEFPRDFDMSTNLNEEGMIQEYIEELMDYREFRLLIIDPLGGAISSSKNIGANSFINDYHLLLSLQRYAIDNNMCIMFIHHTRKLQSGNVFDLVLGSRAVRSAPTTNMVLHSKDGEKAILSMEGRYIREKNYELYFDPEKLEWQLTGDQALNKIITPERQLVINQFNKKDRNVLTTSEIASALNKTPPNISQILNKMCKQGLIEKVAYGTYKLKE